MTPRDTLRSLAAALLLFGLSGCSFGAATSLCQADADIPAGVQGAPVALAKSFADAVLSGQPQSAYAQLAPDLQDKVPPATFGALIRKVGVTGPYAGLGVDHVYRVTVAGAGQVPPVLCGSPSNPDKWAMVAALPVGDQFHVVMTSNSRNNAWTINVWLVPAGTGWRVEAFNVGLQTIGGRSASAILAEARQQRDSGHQFNAAMLYAVLPALIDRGQAFQPGITQEVRSDLAAFKPPTEFAGKPPFAVVWDGRRFSVDRIEVTGFGPVMDLVILYTDPSWNGTDYVRAEAINHGLIDAFRAAHPDYAEKFAGVVARLQRADRKGGFATVYENARGYLKAKGS